MVQSTAAGPATDFLPPPPFLEGGVSGCGFSGGPEAASAAGAGGSAEAAGAASAGGVDGVGVGVAGGYWHGCSLGDELAGRGHGSGTSPRAGFLEYILVERGESCWVLSKFVRRYVIKFVENRCLELKCAG
jgi:hypothetical protein